MSQLIRCSVDPGLIQIFESILVKSLGQSRYGPQAIGIEGSMRRCYAIYPFFYSFLVLSNASQNDL